jgi:hypothetical protein
MEGGRYRYRLADRYRVTHRQEFTFVGMLVSSDAAIVRAGDGTVVDHFDKTKPRTIYLLMRPTGGSWRIVDVQK